mmetsp:Transcript_1307/g.3678  ORF Transcript_1307/g.3678 Transcript_1307/m.3678 type:complete len:90 (-) Transcript_1307:165-434(-)
MASLRSSGLTAGRRVTSASGVLPRPQSLSRGQVQRGQQQQQQRQEAPPRRQSYNDFIEVEEQEPVYEAQLQSQPDAASSLKYNQDEDRL